MSAPVGPSQISGSNQLYDIPYLENNGTNFQTWKYQICTVLRLQGLMKIVDGTTKRLTLIQSANKSTNQLDIDDWDHHDMEAQAQLTLILKDEPLSGVLHATSAADIWNKLNCYYEGKGQNTIAYLIKEIFHASFSDEIPMEPQLNDV